MCSRTGMSYALDFAAMHNFTLAVRNTFVDVDEAFETRHQRCRSHSAPATCSREVACASSFEGEESMSSQWTEISSRQESCHSVASDEEAGMSDTASTEASTPNQHDHVLRIKESLNPSKARWSACLDDEESSTSTSSSGPPIGSAFQHEVLSLTREVEEALRRLSSAPDTEAILCETSCDEGACMLTATLKQEHQDSMYRLTNVAKDTIFSLTSRSRGVCLLGYKKAPCTGFKNTPTGFVAKCGSVSRKKQMCRQFYETGKCSRRDCWWQHPQSISSIHFHVEISA